MEKRLVGTRSYDRQLETGYLQSQASGSGTAVVASARNERPEVEATGLETRIRKRSSNGPCQI
jgi:hypothetical protein